MKLSSLALLLAPLSALAWEIAVDPSGKKYTGTGEQDCTFAPIRAGNRVRVSGLNGEYAIDFFSDRLCDPSTFSRGFVEDGTWVPEKRVQAFSVRAT